MTWGIRAYRSAASTFGAAETWAKRDGKIAVYNSKEEAVAQASTWNKGKVSPNIWYKAESFTYE